MAIRDTEAGGAQAAGGLERWLGAFGRMVAIRHFEHEMHRLFLRGEIHGTTHLSAGQEAVPVGVCAQLEPDDYVAGTYRGHGHALAKGTNPEALAAEMLGRAAGSLRDLGALGDEFVVFLEPPSIDDRIVNQFALFTLMSQPTSRLDAWLAEHQAAHGEFDEDELRAIAAAAGVPYVPPGRVGDSAA